MSEDQGRLNRLKRCFQPRQWFMGEDESLDLSVSNKEDAFMWVYRKGSDGKFEVGFFTPDKVWCPESSHDTAESAAARVHYLMGGRT